MQKRWNYKKYYNPAVKPSWNPLTSRPDEPVPWCFTGWSNPKSALDHRATKGDQFPPKYGQIPLFFRRCWKIPTCSRTWPWPNTEFLLWRLLANNRKNHKSVWVSKPKIIKTNPTGTPMIVWVPSQGYAEHLGSAKTLDSLSTMTHDSANTLAHSLFWKIWNEVANLLHHPSSVSNGSFTRPGNRKIAGQVCSEMTW